MWTTCFSLSIACLVLAVILFFLINGVKKSGSCRINSVHVLFAGVFLAVWVMFLPLNSMPDGATVLGTWRTMLLSLFNSMEVFTRGCGFSEVTENLASCPDWLSVFYQIWAATLFVVAPVLSVGLLLSLFRNLSARLQYWGAYFKDVYVFSELNEKSLTLAMDLRKKHKASAIVFTTAGEGKIDSTSNQIESAKKIGAICFKQDVLSVNFRRHSNRKPITFFVLGLNEPDNLTKALKLIDLYKDRQNTHLYVFSTQLESELLLTSVNKGHIRVRRVNEVRSLINRILYEQGQVIFESAATDTDGSKHISAVVVGLGRHGTEMVKALAWFAQMDGYSVEINAFDMDPLAEEKFTALAPELMSPKYNGVRVLGESHYQISIHSAVQTDTITFAEKIAGVANATYVLVALGDDELNINTAIRLRMYFERIKIHPVIKAIVYNTKQANALRGITNFSGQKYDIDFIGDLETSYSEEVILHSKLEEEALRGHMQWGEEEEFWTYEYNYRSSVAAAIHRKARLQCGMPGAGKKEEDLTEEERVQLEALEHRRWNAYMRAEGYIFSGEKDASSRNDLAKMHNDLVDYSELSDEEKRKDSKIGAVGVT